MNPITKAEMELAINSKRFTADDFKERNGNIRFSDPEKVLNFMDFLREQNESNEPIYTTAVEITTIPTVEPIEKIVTVEKIVKVPEHVFIEMYQPPDIFIDTVFVKVEVEVEKPITVLSYQQYLVILLRQYLNLSLMTITIVISIIEGYLIGDTLLHGFIRGTLITVPFTFLSIISALDKIIKAMTTTAYLKSLKGDELDAKYNLTKVDKDKIENGTSKQAILEKYRNHEIDKISFSNLNPISVISTIIIGVLTTLSLMETTDLFLSMAIATLISIAYLISINKLNNR